MRALIGVLLLIQAAASAASVTTSQYDNSRTGANTAETILTQATVASNFGLICSVTISGRTYAQPLIIEGIGGLTVGVIVTMSGNVYMYNADGCGVIWSHSVGTPQAHVGDPFAPDGVSVSVGCVSTPVVDPTTNVLYVDCATTGGHWSIFSYNLADGSTFHAAVENTGSVTGAYGTINFSGAIEVQRPGLVLANGNIYVSFGSYSDTDATWYGWFMAYDKTSLAQVAIWNATPGGNGAALWMSGCAPAVDGSGNLIAMTGNGDSDWNGILRFPESFVKLSSTLTLLDWMTPTNWATLDAGDSDMGSGCPLLFSTFITGTGKYGVTFRLNQSSLGHLQGSGDPVPQSWTTSGYPFGNFGGQAYANNTLFLSNKNGGTPSGICAYTFTGSTITTTPVACTATDFNRAKITYSSNGATANTAILWAPTTTATGVLKTDVAGTLRAFNPATMVEIWNSGSTLGFLAHFAMPTVANGRVHVPTWSNAVRVYGFYPATNARQGRVTVRNGAVIR